MLRSLTRARRAARARLIEEFGVEPLRDDWDVVLPRA